MKIKITCRDDDWSGHIEMDTTDPSLHLMRFLEEFDGHRIKVTMCQEVIGYHSGINKHGYEDQIPLLGDYYWHIEVQDDYD